MNNTIKQIILNTLSENNMIGYGDRIIVGVSGGADSMCLLHFLISIRKEMSLELIVAHINHNLRGDEAIRDQNLVSDFCCNNNVQCQILSADINKISAETGESSEECGRRIRYEFFNKLCGRNGKIATAHTLSDSCETVLFNIARGTGIKGLTGIPKLRDNIIRPLIDITRQQVEEYCKENKIVFITDSTNLENYYNRNKIRNIVIPVFKDINPSFEFSVGRLLKIAEGQLCLLDKLASNVLSDAIVKDGYNCDIIRKNDSIIIKQVVINLLKERGCTSFEERHINLIVDTIYNLNGVVQLPGRFICSAKQGILRVYKSVEQNNHKKSVDTNRAIFPKKSCEFVINNQKVSIQIISKEEFDKIMKVNKLLVKNSLDYDIIHDETQFRTRMSGDVFKQFERGVTKSLKKLFSEAKIPSEKRDDIIIVANGSEVLWVQGFGVSQISAVTPNTKKVAVILI
ncbi:MAG: tRNA lysidine(34) synthetase TilS [Acutalibacteraceae bacterium]|nr:tRNA lysidine(34) synthetase TilS [Acutalibacteraceae bacterium]